MVTCSIITPEP